MEFNIPWMVIKEILANIYFSLGENTFLNKTYI